MRRGCHGPGAFFAVATVCGCQPLIDGVRAAAHFDLVAFLRPARRPRGIQIFRSHQPVHLGDLDDHCVLDQRLPTAAPANRPAHYSIGESIGASQPPPPAKGSGVGKLNWSTHAVPTVKPPSRIFSTVRSTQLSGVPPNSSHSAARPALHSVQTLRANKSCTVGYHRQGVQRGTARVTPAYPWRRAASHCRPAQTSVGRPPFHSSGARKRQNQDSHSLVVTVGDAY